MNIKNYAQVAVVLLLGAYNTYARVSAGSPGTGLWVGVAFPLVGLVAVFRESGSEQRGKALDWLLAGETMLLFG